MMLRGKLCNSFVGFPLHVSIDGRNNAFWERKHSLKKRGFRKCYCAKQNHWVSRAIWFSHFVRKNVELLKKNIGSRSAFVVKSVREPLTRSKDIVRSFNPLWHEGLLLFRCSVFVVVFSGLCLLVWYGQKRTKGFIEEKLLPSVCSTLSESIHRDLDFGKVKRISPLSITLESCSFGPHEEEFSCGEVPSIKLRLLPFASLKRGKIVIDAVLSRPTLSVAQKKDFTWLGIPPSSEKGLQRHRSSEEGIDQRTRTRRLAREEAADRWTRQRDDAAREASENGYVLYNKDVIPSEDESLREDTVYFTKLKRSDSFLCVDEKMHWRDHHCVDTGADYDTKHADLEKSFGVKIPGTGVKLWSRKQNIKRKTNGSDASEDSLITKRRILNRSAQAAVSYFRRLSDEPIDESSSSGSYDIVDLNPLYLTRERDVNATNYTVGYEGHLAADSNDKEKVEHTSFNASTTTEDEKETLSNVTGLCDAFPTSNEVEQPSESSSIDYVVGGDNLKSDTSDVDASNLLPDHGVSKSHNGRTIKSPALIKFRSWISVNWPVNILDRDLKFHSYTRSVSEQLFSLLTSPFQKFKSDIAPKLTGFVTGVEMSQPEGIRNMLPVTLDSVHFKGGSLMLLAYGDQEPRSEPFIDQLCFTLLVSVGSYILKKCLLVVIKTYFFDRH